MLSPDVPTFSVSICAYFAPYPSMWISACMPIFWQVIWAKIAPYTTITYMFLDVNDIATGAGVVCRSFQGGVITLSKIFKLKVSVTL